MDRIGLFQPSPDARAFARRRAMLAETPGSPYWAHHFYQIQLVLSHPDRSRPSMGFAIHQHRVGASPRKTLDLLAGAS